MVRCFSRFPTDGAIAVEFNEPVTKTGCSGSWTLKPATGTDVVFACTDVISFGNMVVPALRAALDNEISSEQPSSLLVPLCAPLCSG